MSDNMAVRNDDLNDAILVMLLIEFSFAPRDGT